MLFSVVFAGAGICKGILDGRMLGEILPYYIASFLGLYLYFSLSAMIDIKGKRRVLKTNLIDYLENHLVRQDPGDGAGLREIVRGVEAPRQADGGIDADPGQGCTAAGDGSGDRKRGISTEHEMSGKTEDRGMSQQEESSKVTEEELQALLQELLTV